MNNGTLIGYISACIANDSRYTSRCEVFQSPDGKTVDVVMTENGAAGGMDGPGGSTPFHETSRVTVPAKAADVVKAIKVAFRNENPNVIARYGTPTKKFVWCRPERSQGLSVARCAVALRT